MIPIYELLSRIHWDKQFGSGDIVVGYYDKFEACIIRIPVREILLKPDDHFSFDLIDRNGVLHSIPMCLIREVRKDGKLIWHRDKAR